MLKGKSVVNGISLFTGSGIGELAFKQIIPNYRTVCYVEWDKYCQQLLQQRIKDGVLDDAPIWDDVRTFDGKPWAGKVDFISGGFPCQPFSVAGKGKAEKDERNMWTDTHRIISEVRPRYAFLENVPNLLTHKYIRRIFGDLAEIGYDCEWDVVSAAYVGARHLRKRLWILAYPKHNDRRGYKPRINRENGTGGFYKTFGQPETNEVTRSGKRQQAISDSECMRKSQSEGSEQNIRGRSCDCCKNVPDPQSQRIRGIRNKSQEKRTSDSNELSGKRRGVLREIPNTICERGCSRNPEREEAEDVRELRSSKKLWYWDIEPDVGRVANGVPKRVDRLKTLGNGWVPQVVRRILEVKII